MPHCKGLKQGVAAVIGCLVLLPSSLWAGAYLNSAHGSSSAGVDRPATTSYATGNCAHCHEMHASVAGSEPAPASGGPSSYTLFADNFNSGAVGGSYLLADNFCFYCHSAAASVQAVLNKDYSATFGGASAGPQYIMEAFNQASYHNLADIHDFVDGENTLFPWYTASSNPCNACHNPHLAKRNYQDFTAPLSSAISKPSDHFNLWAESELMSSYTTYLAPYANSTTQAREPDGGSTTDGSKTPDYVGFCTDCHNSTNIIYSTSLGRNLLDIDWTSSGDKHGVVARDGSGADSSLDGLNPYEAVDSTATNFVLSCLDCHEPHGSPHIMLLRRRANGSDLGSTIADIDDMDVLCGKCHNNDWEYVHHFSGDRPYVQIKCGDCHPGGGGGSPSPIPCGDCHLHGMIDPEGTGRKTF